MAQRKRDGVPFLWWYQVAVFKGGDASNRVKRLEGGNSTVWVVSLSLSVCLYSNPDSVECPPQDTTHRKPCGGWWILGHHRKGIKVMLASS